MWMSFLYTRPGASMLLREDMFESKPQDLDWTVRTGEGSMLRDLH